MSKTCGQIIRELRERENIPLRKLAYAIDVDQAILSKAERGLKVLTEEQICLAEDFFSLKKNELLNVHLSEKIIQLLRYSKEHNKILDIVSKSLKKNSSCPE